MARGARVATRRLLWGALALVVLTTGATASLVPRPAAAATFSVGEGGGPGWCAKYGGTNLASFENVYACKPTGAQSGVTPFDFASGFQCVELANRFLWDHWDRQPIFDANAADDDLDGSTFASTVHAVYPSVHLVSNGTPRQPYEPGDVVSFAGKPGKEPDGHVAVVMASTEDDSGNGTVTVLEQNAPTGPGGSETMTVSDWSLETPATSWVTPSNFDAFASPPSPTSSPPPAPHGTTAPGSRPAPTHLGIGQAFNDHCVVAWPTAPTITSNSIIMTMSCEHVPESQYLFTQVQYDDPHLDITPATGTVSVIGTIIDIATSDYGYKELVVQASKVVLPS